MLHLVGKDPLDVDAPLTIASRMPESTGVRIDSKTLEKSLLKCSSFQQLLDMLQMLSRSSLVVEAPEIALPCEVYDDVTGSLFSFTDLISRAHMIVVAGSGTDC